MLDSVLPVMSALTNLDSDTRLFSVSAVIRAARLECLVLHHWTTPEIEQLCTALGKQNRVCEAVLPRLRVLEVHKCDEDIRERLGHICKSTNAITTSARYVRMPLIRDLARPPDLILFLATIYDTRSPAPLDKIHDPRGPRKYH